jgi:transposase
MAFELGRKKWKVGFTTGLGQKPREKNVDGGDTKAVLAELALAKRRFGLAADVRVVGCYEAGPEGFWLHRFLGAHGVENHVVDSSSIEVNRRQRRAKSDGLDLRALLTLLVRHTLGEKKVWSVVRVPDVASEDARHVHRDLATLVEERTRGRNRIRALLYTQGLQVRRWPQLRAELQAMRRWDGTELGQPLRDRIERELVRLEGVAQQIKALEQEMEVELTAAVPAGSAGAMMQRLAALRSVGPQTARVLAFELFGWRQFRNRRQVGGLIGLTPTPYQSGASAHEQGISKAGNVWIRRVAIQLAWNWLRWQPQSELSHWFERRFAHGGRRQRRVGIVAVARRLLIALWRYAEGGAAPVGAILGPMDTYVLKVA